VRPRRFITIGPAPGFVACYCLDHIRHAVVHGSADDDDGGIAIDAILHGLGQPDRGILRGDHVGVVQLADTSQCFSLCRVCVRRRVLRKRRFELLETVYGIDGDGRSLQPAIIRATDREPRRGEHFEAKRLAGLQSTDKDQRSEERQCNQRVGYGEHFSVAIRGTMVAMVRTDSDSRKGKPVQLQAPFPE
jgi:hypothetical protein